MSFSQKKTTGSRMEEEKGVRLPGRAKYGVFCEYVFFTEKDYRQSHGRGKRSETAGTSKIRSILRVCLFTEKDHRQSHGRGKRSETAGTSKATALRARLFSKKMVAV